LSIEWFESAGAKEALAKVLDIIRSSQRIIRFEGILDPDTPYKNGIVTICIHK